MSSKLKQELSEARNNIRKRISGFESELSTMSGQPIERELVSELIRVCNIKLSEIDTRLNIDAAITLCRCCVKYIADRLDNHGEPM